MFHSIEEKDPNRVPRPMVRVQELIAERVDLGLVQIVIVGKGCFGPTILCDRSVPAGPQDRVVQRHSNRLFGKAVRPACKNILNRLVDFDALGVSAVSQHNHGDFLIQPAFDECAKSGRVSRVPDTFPGSV